MPEEKKNARSSQEVKDFMALAMSRFRTASEAESEWRKLGLEDLKFSLGEHWDDDIKTKREKAGRPCLTMNHIGQSVKQVTNNQRQQRPAVQVNPAGDGSTVEVGEVYQGVVRHIEVQSDAEVADDMAFEYMVRTGKGFTRLLTEYIDDDGSTNDQEIYIAAIWNPFTVYSDPSATKPDKSDARYRFIVEDIPVDQYRDEHKDTELAKYSASQLTSIGDSEPGWADQKTIRRAEYFYVETKEVEGKARKYFQKTVKWALINAIEIIEEREWPGKFIPIFEVTGDDLIVDGKRHCAGMVRDAKEPSRFYDYQVSAAAEVLALAPKTPFIGWKGQFSDPKWETANQENWAYLEADPLNIEGLPNPGLPQRNAVESPIVAISQMIRQADNDIKATTGLYDASLGQKGPDQSGKAILQRKQQGDNATFNYTDNLVRMIRVRGRAILDLAKKVYDAPRVQRIINPDGTSQHVGLYNSSAEAGQGVTPETLQGMEEFKAVKRFFDIGAGRYDITVSVGPSYQTKRQESAEMMLELMKAVPIVQQAAPDLVIREMDGPNFAAVADRVKKLLPPQLQDEDDQSPEMELQKAKSQLQQLSQQAEMTGQALQQAHQIIETKKVEQDAKIQIAQMQEMSRQEIVKMQEATKLAVAQINASKDANQSFAENEIAEYKILHDAAHDQAMSEVGHQQAQELALQGHQQNLEAGEQSAAQQQQAAEQNAAIQQQQAQQAQNSPQGENA